MFFLSRIHVGIITEKIPLKVFLQKKLWRRRTNAQTVCSCAIVFVLASACSGITRTHTIRCFMLFSITNGGATNQNGRDIYIYTHTHTHTHTHNHIVAPEHVHTPGHFECSNICAWLFFPPLAQHNKHQHTTPTSSRLISTWLRRAASLSSSEARRSSTFIVDWLIDWFGFVFVDISFRLSRPFFYFYWTHVLQTIIIKF